MRTIQMKTLILTLALLVSASAQATTRYSCVDAEKNVATLTVITAKIVQWNEPWHSANSTGKYVGIEAAPFDSEKGSYLYQLIDFYGTNDSAFYLALSSLGGNKIKAVTYFDNDDHKEDRTVFTCVKK